MKNLSYLFLTVSFGLIGYFLYNAIADSDNFVADSTRFSHPAFVLGASLVSLFIAFVMNKKAQATPSVSQATTTATVDLQKLSKRLDNIEDRVEIIEENEVKTRQLLTELLSNENDFNPFNLNPKDFNPTLTQELDLIPIDEETNRLELQPIIIVENQRKKTQKASKNT